MDDFLPAFFFLWQEKEAHAILAFSRKLEAFSFGYFAHECIGHLDQNTGAVACFRVGTNGAAMFQILKYFQAISDHVMAFAVVNIGYKANAAGVMLVFWIVEAARRGEARRAHGFLPFASCRRKGLSAFLVLLHTLSHL